MLLECTWFDVQILFHCHGRIKSIHLVELWIHFSLSAVIAALVIGCFNQDTFRTMFISFVIYYNLTYSCDP